MGLLSKLGAASQRLLASSWRLHKASVLSAAVVTRSQSTDPCVGADNIYRSVFADTTLPNEPLWPFLDRHMKDYGDKTAFVCSMTGKRYTHAEIREMVPKIAASLHDMGVRKGDAFCIYSVNVPDYIVLVVALNAIGAVPALVSPGALADDLARQMKMADAKYIATVGPLVEFADKACSQLENVKTKVIFGPAVEGYRPFSSLTEGSAAGMPDVDIDPSSDLAALPFSSGTTGLPKGVMLTHNNITANMAQFKAACKPGDTNIGCDDTTIGVLPFFHIYGLVVIGLNGLHCGHNTVTMPKFEPEPFLQNVQEHKATQLYLVPPIMVFMAKHPMVANYDISSVKAIYSGAAPLGPELSAEFQEKTGIETIRQAYGLTETSPVTHSNPAVDWRHGSIGQLLPNTLAKIVDAETGEAVGPGGVGELYIYGPQVMKGYLDNPEATSDCMTEDGWFKTGDVSAYDGDGFFSIVDRLKELIKYKGFQVPPAEVEGVLLQHPAIADAAVIGVPDDEAGELPRAYVVLKPDAEATEDDVKNFVAEHLAAYKKLRGGVVFIEAVPKSASGKILRKDLRAML